MNETIDHLALLIRRHLNQADPEGGFPLFPGPHVAVWCFSDEDGRRCEVCVDDAIHMPHEVLGRVHQLIALHPQARWSVTAGVPTLQVTVFHDPPKTLDDWARDIGAIVSDLTTALTYLLPVVVPEAQAWNVRREHVLNILRELSQPNEWSDGEDESEDDDFTARLIIKPERAIYDWSILRTPGLTRLHMTGLVQRYPADSARMSFRILQLCRVARSLTEHVVFALQDPTLSPEDRFQHLDAHDRDILTTARTGQPGSITRSITGQAHDVAPMEAAVPRRAVGTGKAASPPLSSPQALAAELGKVVIGQEHALRQVSTAVYGHVQDLSRRTCCLLVGPTGSGKSHLMNALHQATGLTTVHVNASALVPAGIVGQSIADVGRAIWNQAKQDRHRAEQSVVMFDEFDKLVFNRVLEYGPCVTGQLLRLMDGDTLTVDSRVTLSTHRMLFILAGAWTALRDAKTADANQAPIGFGTRPAGAAIGPQRLDLTNLELPAELGGRVTHFIELEPHSALSLRALIASDIGGPLVSLRQHSLRWRRRLTVTSDAMDLLAHLAAQSPFGARALNNLVQQLTDAVLWQWQPSSTASDIVIDAAFVRVVCLRSTPVPCLA